MSQIITRHTRYGPVEVQVTSRAIYISRAKGEVEPFEINGVEYHPAATGILCPDVAESELKFLRLDRPGFYSVYGTGTLAADRKLCQLAKELLAEFRKPGHPMVEAAREEESLDAYQRMLSDRANLEEQLAALDARIAEWEAKRLEFERGSAAHQAA